MNLPFRAPSEATRYCIFPEVLEEDPLVFFHGTAQGNLDSIIRHGFRPRPPLESVSFSHRSSLCIAYACNARNNTSPDGVVIAVRFSSLEGRRIAREQWGIYLYDVEF
jgi:RNA:NAD 2'-phosphotransferase (TPT1/KptA family)